MFFQAKKTEKTTLNWFFKELFSSIFTVSFFTFVLFFFLELFKTGLITNYFNFNIVLIICLFSGIIIAVLQKEETKREAKKLSLGWPLILGGLTGILLYNFINFSEIISISISALGGLLVFLILILINK